MSKPSVVIKRNKWRCGGAEANPERIGEGYTMLRNSQGFMCCLGFACKQLGGLSDDDLGDFSTPAFRVIPHLSENVEGIDDRYDRFKSTALSCVALKINDNPQLSTSEREEQLIDLFGKHGVSLKFVNKYSRKDRDK